MGYRSLRFVVPGFGGLQAFNIVFSLAPELPFIVVSGEISEEVAVAAMRAGAHDYVLKSNLKRMVPAVEREIAEAANRRNDKETEKALGSAEELIFRL